MYIKCFFCVSIAVLFIATALSSYAQIGVTDTTGKRLEIIEALRYNYQNLQGSGTFVSVAGNVRIRQGGTLFYCDSIMVFKVFLHIPAAI